MAPRRHFDDDYRERATLRDGTEVLLRLVQPSDKPLFLQGLQGMSPESRYLRFFTAKNHLSEAELHYLVDVDQETHFAIGALVEDEHGERGVGVGRFVRLSDGATADPAVAVLDEMQGKGLGRLLFLRLVAAARERGVEQFRCEVLVDNEAMRHLLHELAPLALEHHDGDVVVVEMSLPDVHAAELPQSDIARGAIYRLLRLTAREAVALWHRFRW